MKRDSMFGAGLALLALAASTGAQAAEAGAPCLTEEEISALAIYAMPGLIGATQTSCTAQLSPNGFMATGGTAMAQRYAAKGDAVWPRAKSALFKFAGDLKDKDLATVASLPDEAIRPLMDALIEQKVAEEIHPNSCKDIERLARVVDVLDPETTGALTGVIVSLALGGKEKPKVCPAGPS